jgi:hypothetical protein
MAATAEESLETSILSGQFDDFERAEVVANELRLLGFPGDHIEQ